MVAQRALVRSQAIARKRHRPICLEQLANLRELQNLGVKNQPDIKSLDGVSAAVQHQLDLDMLALPNIAARWPDHQTSAWRWRWHWLRLPVLHNLAKAAIVRQQQAGVTNIDGAIPVEIRA